MNPILLLRIEKGLILLSAVGMLFKYLHLPFASMILIMSLSTLGMFYFFTTFSTMVKLDLGLGRLSRFGVLLSLVPIGVLFKIELWPMAEMHLQIGLGVSFFITGFMLYDFFQRTNGSTGMAFIRPLAMTCVAACFLLIPNSSLINHYCEGDEDCNRILNLLQKEPGNQEYQQEYKDWLDNK